MKGKNYSCNNTGKRNKNDFYQTPYSITKQLIETGELDDCDTLLEPACGEHAITNVLTHNLKNKSIIEYDLYYDNFNYGVFDYSFDFFKETRKFDCIITNPPFSLATEFILHAKKIATKKIILLLPLNYLHGINRLNKIWCDTQFKFKCPYVFARYPLLENTVREDGKYKTGMQVYAWYVWDREWRDEPVIRHIDNNRYISKKGE